MESRRNSQALITSYIEKLRVAFIDVCNNDANINQTQFCAAFTSVFNGLTADTVNQIYDEFIQSIQSQYTIYNNTINYNLLLNDDRLPRILIILHNYSISQITEFHRDIAYKLLDHNITAQNNTNFLETSQLQTNECNSNEQILITSLIQKLTHSFGEISNNSIINYNEFFEGFNSVFIGIKNDIYQQIFNGFDILKTGQINYYKMLKDVKLPKILLLLYENSTTQINHLQNEKITENEKINENEKQNGELPDNLNENFNFFETISNLKKENKKLMRELNMRAEEITTLQEYNDKLDAIAIEWKDKYEMEIKQNKNYQIELENDLEEEYKTKLNAIILEYENKLSEEKENYELLINEYNVKYEILLKEKEDEIENTIKKYKQLLFDIEKEKQKNKTGMFNILNKVFNSTETDLKQIGIELKQIGIIKLNILNTYNCLNSEKRLISIYGLIFDVTNSNKYNVNGIYSEFCGHDITLCIIFNKYNLKWCDKFVQLNYKQIQIIRDYIKGFKKEFICVGKLENYQEIQTNWPKLTDEQLNELQHDDDCLIM